jgi:hypothetical protein
MKHIMALLVKFVVTAAALEIVLGFATNMSAGSILLIALTVTIVSYFLGDLVILPRSNNTVATAADFGIALFNILLFDAIFVTADITFLDAFFGAAVLAVCEWIFHRFLSRSLLPGRR